MTKETGGAAFPQTIDDMGTMRSLTQGMTLRDYFAGQALIGLHFSHVQLAADTALAAKWSYEQADAMIAARKDSDEAKAE